MPSWKKVLISGSDAALNSLNITAALTASGITYPSTDGTTGQVITTDGGGNLSFSTIASEGAVSASFATTASYALFAQNGGIPLYTHTQTLPASTWTVLHNLGTTFPIVTVYDSSSNVIIPQEITSISDLSISITFPQAVAGYASVAGGTFGSVSQFTTQEQSTINALIFG